jgi:hypothetical protein
MSHNAEDAEREGVQFVHDEITMKLGNVPTPQILDTIRARVKPTWDNYQNLIDHLEFIAKATGTGQTDDPDDPELKAMDAALQFRHALEDLARDLETEEA